MSRGPMQPKVYIVTIDGVARLVRAVTKAGAVKIAVAYLAGQVDVELATGEQLFRAGARGAEILPAHADNAQAELPLASQPEPVELPPGLRTVLDSRVDP